MNDHLFSPFLHCQVLKSRMPDPSLCSLNTFNTWSQWTQYILKNYLLNYLWENWGTVFKWLGQLISPKQMLSVRLLMATLLANLICSEAVTWLLLVHLWVYKCCLLRSSLVAKYLQRSKQTLTSSWWDCWKAIPILLGLATISFTLFFFGYSPYDACG